MADSMVERERDREMAEGVISNVLFWDEAEQQLVFGIARCGLVGFPRWVTALGVWYGMVWYGTVRYGQEQYITGMDGNIQDPTVIFLNWTKQGDGE